ncbi:MAG TPA: 6,7-dimethyl-8-ribityllumazine synthase [Cyclobacteriaceae bacterium]|jgi:6,7-dimethyl-8-ribityllumazine synthase|nr:6,7-dimethyl-8-ribityllumazine synthase [Cytophagales bacterium]HMR57507.1 6,7-dimethyl-8-ribityllumazine synthase [Cyclobacteriaceae bacterium]HNT49347.1 6,7-dimethyl-8-ribityllumazine synthase [Cyclobacteriaceae bacterium]HRE65955.1 6,7-dimethyl-8-ribityllumazine synthase [Cyclobacteriaceae bacterium]HRF33927.1 6,7-dimethyl-8-ribityllumazine synthase [Cyclobacteriaceae bacterium]
MAGQLKTVSGKSKIDLAKKKFAIVVAEWNEDITEALYDGAYQALRKLGVKKSGILRKNVPGTFELTLGALWMAEEKNIDAVICIGCVIQGDTPHFDYICQGVTYGITEVNIKTKKPVIFGVLTTLNKKQALERAGGKLGNKGEEAAVTAVKMLEFR